MPEMSYEEYFGTDKKNRLITHFKKHKWKYICVACIVGGVVIGYLVKSRPIINNTAIGHNVINNINSKLENSVQTILERRGHPGNIIRCKETGEVFASQNRCAELLGITPASLSQHLRGKAEHAGNLHFEILGEAGQSIA